MGIPPKPDYSRKKNTLPAPIRGQHTFGYSWIAYTAAAELAGCRKFAFSLDDVEAIAESGKELLSAKPLGWKAKPENFLEDLDKWLIHRQAPQPPLLEGPQSTDNQARLY